MKKKKLEKIKAILKSIMMIKKKLLKIVNAEN